MRKNIAIITGGDSKEYEISLQSAETVKNCLNPKLYRSVVVNIQEGKFNAIIEGKYYPIQRNNFSLKIKNENIRFDTVFMALHGPPAENGLIQKYFDKLNIPYTSCNSEISACTFNKSSCQKKLQELGFNCTDFYHYKEQDKIDSKSIIKKVGLPCFVKPNASGSSCGITKVKKGSDIYTAISKALKHDKEVIIERFVDGLEVSCGVFQDKEIIALPITEIISENEFFDFEAKYKGKSKEITPARINKKLTDLIQETTISIYKLLKLKGICRIDFIISKDIPFVIEINTIPGLSKESIIPKQIAKSNFTIQEVFEICIKKSRN